MESPAPASAPRRGHGHGHLKRLSLSVGASSTTAGAAQQHYMSSAATTPDRTTSTGADSLSPLHRSLGSSSSGRRMRTRPMSMHAGPGAGAGAGHASFVSALENTLLSPSPQPSSPLPAVPPAAASNMPTSTPDQHETAAIQDNQGNSVAHPLSLSTPTREGALSPSSSSVASPSPSSSIRSNSASGGGRRSILGRSAHARRQSSISYARSPSNDSPSSVNATAHSNTPSGTPRSSLTAIRDEDEEEQDAAGLNATARPSPSPVGSAQTPSRHSLDRQRSSMDGNASVHEPATQQNLLGTSPSSINELNIGPGARSSDLLTFIAKKERRCLDLREELAKQEAELATLKKKWEQVIQREMQASTSPSSSSTNMSPSNSQSSITGATSLFSSLTSTLNASTSSTSSIASQSTNNVASPSPSSRRLLTNRHSISVASPSQRAGQSGAGSMPYFGGGADLSPQTSPLSALHAAQQGPATAALDVQKLAKSWLGGVMKSASTVLEGLAPPPPGSGNDLHTVAEEEEEEEEDDENEHTMTRNRSQAGHPSAIGSRSPHNRKESTATNTTISTTSEVSSPSSSCEDGQFSSGVASRSSSVSSLHSDGRRKDDDEGRGDTTPIATPVLPHNGEQGPNGTPRANGGGRDEMDERDLWGGEFEDDSAREKRETMERNRIDIAKGSPRKESSSTFSPKPVRPANHGRRRSTAFELGGAWGAMVGKKWNEMTSQLSSSETFKNSSKKAMGIMEGFEKSLSEAITPDPNNEYGREGHSTQLMLVNGELIPTGDWSPVSSPSQQSEYHQQQQNHRQQQHDLPSGIGGPATWSALLGRTKSSSSNSSASKSPQSESSNSWNGNGRPSKSLLDEDDYENNTGSDRLNVMASPPPTAVQRTSLSPTPLTAQERIQASRAKHAKRMSMPVNGVHASNGSAINPIAKKESFGLGLEGVHENEEDEGAWGW